MRASNTLQPALTNFRSPLSVLAEVACAITRKKKQRHCKVKSVMIAWMELHTTHPYPTKIEKIKFCKMGSLRYEQVERFLIHYREGSLRGKFRPWYNLLPRDRLLALKGPVLPHNKGT